MISRLRAHARRVIRPCMCAPHHIDSDRFRLATRTLEGERRSGTGAGCEGRSARDQGDGKLRDGAGENRQAERLPPAHRVLVGLGDALNCIAVCRLCREFEEAAGQASDVRHGSPGLTRGRSAVDPAALPGTGPQLAAGDRTPRPPAHPRTRSGFQLALPLGSFGTVMLGGKRITP